MVIPDVRAQEGQQVQGGGDCMNSYGNGNILNRSNFHGPVQFNNYSENKTELQFLNDLSVIDPEDNKTRIEGEKGGLLEGSYDWILGHTDFQKWYDNAGWRMLWIKGPPGTGKTMLMCGIINHLAGGLGDRRPGRPSQVFHFFCEAGDTTRNTAETVLRGLIRSCLKVHSSLIPVVRQELHVGDALFADKNAWQALSKMIIKILKRPELEGTILLVDALDECNDKSRDKLLNFINFINESKDMDTVKWVVSSRDWQNIESELEQAGLTLVLDLEQNETEVSNSIGAYINHRVDDLKRKFARKKGTPVSNNTWSEFKSRLQSRAGGTFLWVAMVCDRLEDNKNAARVSNILQILDEFPAGLDPLFERMLIDTSWSKSDDKLCKEVLATAAVLYRPASLNEMRSLVEPQEDFSPEDWERLVRSCGSFLSIRDGVIRFLHQSAKEYLCNKRQKGFKQIFPEGDEDRHKLVSLRCRKLLWGKFDTEGWPNELAGVPIGSSINMLSDQVLYACLFWLDHLKESGKGDDSVRKFVDEHFLHWLEALARIGMLSEGTRAVAQLGEMSSLSTGCLPAFWDDASRFIASFGSIIQEAPMQAYGGALAFCPLSNSIRKKFWGQRVQFLRDSRGINDKESLLQAMKGYHEAGIVTALAFSPDGKVLASCTSSTKVPVVLLWYTATGELWKVLEGHAKPVHTATFSLNGKMVASGSEDGEIKLWDTGSGELKHTLNSPSQIEGEITALAFLQDNKTLASALDGGKTNGYYSIALWNIETECLKRTILQRPSNPLSMLCNQAAFSPDKKWALLVLQDEKTENDMAVWLPDMEGGHQQEPILRISERLIAATAFSEDGKIFAIASSQQLADLSTHAQIQLCSTKERKEIRTVKGQGPITAIAFCPDREVALSPDQRIAFRPDQKILASATSDANVEIWDTDTGALKHIFTGSNGWTSTVAFSPQGSVMAAGSDNGHVRLWDTIVDTKSYQVYEDRVDSVEISSDGQLVASTSSDKTVRLWEVATGRCKEILHGHADRVTAAVFSLSGKLLASASYDRTIKVWDVRNGICIRTFEGHADTVTDVSFSPEGMTIVAASKDCTVRLWCAKNNRKSIFEGHRLSVNAVSFSPDGTAVASASDDGTARVWDIESGSHVSLMGGKAQLVAVAFSSNGSRVVAASADREIWWWDANDGSNAGSMKAPGRYSCGSGMTQSEGAYYLKALGCLRDGFSPPSTCEFWTFPTHENGENWIKQNGKQMLKPPEEYRATCLAIWGNTIVQGHRNGKVTFLELASSREE